MFPLGVETTFGQINAHEPLLPCAAWWRGACLLSFDILSFIILLPFYLDSIFSSVRGDISAVRHPPANSLPPTIGTARPSELQREEWADVGGVRNKFRAEEQTWPMLPAVAQFLARRSPRAAFSVIPTRISSRLQSKTTTATKSSLLSGNQPRAMRSQFWPKAGSPGILHHYVCL